MGDEDNGLVSHAATQALPEHVVGGVVVHSGQRIVQQDNVRGRVGGTCHIDALALTSRQVDATETAQGLVALSHRNCHFRSTDGCHFRTTDSELAVLLERVSRGLLSHSSRIFLSHNSWLEVMLEGIRGKQRSNELWGCF